MHFWYLKSIYYICTFSLLGEIGFEKTYIININLKKNLYEKSKVFLDSTLIIGS